jgi:hypothetical protein
MSAPDRFSVSGRVTKTPVIDPQGHSLVTLAVHNPGGPPVSMRVFFTARHRNPVATLDVGSRLDVEGFTLTAPDGRSVNIAKTIGWFQIVDRDAAAQRLAALGVQPRTPGQPHVVSDDAPRTIVRSAPIWPTAASIHAVA